MRMGKKVYLHIGAHKSASTTIQANARASRKILESEYGISSLLPEDISGTEFAKHFQGITGRERVFGVEEYQASLRSAKLCITKMIENCTTDDVFISWEGVLGHCSLDLYGGIYTHSKVVAESLGAIFQDYPTKVIMLIRRQDTFIESCYLQQIKAGRFLSFDEFTSGIDVAKIFWGDIASDLAEVFGDSLLIIPFEVIKDLGAHHFIESTLSYLTDRPIKLDKAKITERANESMSSYGVEIARELFPHVSDANRVILRKIIFTEFGGSKFGKAIYFNDFSRRLISDVAKSDNANIYQNYLVNFISFSGLDADRQKNIWLSPESADLKGEGNEYIAPEVQHKQVGPREDERSKGLLHMANWSFWRRKKHDC
ncbi:hypothetical protein [Stutzerimonas degradans]|uniref:hypothetical protein n=1 Tax=Stutzerimonas degradans TaxID=2968968 RepID=UPI001F606FDC|nr:hypothetical protein [Stutzerimonas degradans]